MGVGAVAKPYVTGNIADCIRFATPKAAEWERTGNQINAALVAVRSNLVMHAFAVNGSIPRK